MNQNPLDSLSLSMYKFLVALIIPYPWYIPKALTRKNIQPNRNQIERSTFNTQISGKNELLTHTQNTQTWVLTSSHNSVFSHTQTLTLT